MGKDPAPASAFALFLRPVVAPSAGGFLPGWARLGLSPHRLGRGERERAVMREAVSYTHLTLPTICSV